MKLSWRTELPQWLILGGMFLLAASSWSRTPDRVPVHWGLQGQVDRYGGRFEGLLGIPLLALGIYAAMLLLPRVDPGRANYERFAGAYATTRIAVLTLMAAIYGIIHLWVRGIQVDVAAAVPFLVGALFLIFGNILGKVRPNWFFGIRTPWTLSSKLSWTRTHRAGGWLFVALGLAFMAVGVVRASWAVWAASGLMLAGAAGLAVYSYVVWRGDPDKIPPAGTLPA